MAEGKLDLSVSKDNNDSSNQLKSDVAAKFHQSIGSSSNTAPEANKNLKAETPPLTAVVDTTISGLKRTDLLAITERLAQTPASAAKASAEEETILDSAAKNSKTARYAMVTAEGLAYSVPGVFKAVAHDVTHPLEFAGKMGVAASIGVAMKVALPKSGVGKAIVGTVMGYYMVKDALHPVLDAYSAVSDGKDMKTIHKAAEKMGDGIGLFAWDTYTGNKVGLKAEKWAGHLMEAKLGTTRYSNFEKAKVDFFSSDEYFVGRTLNKIAKPVDKVAGIISERLTRKPEEPKVSLEEAVRKFQEVKEQNAYTSLSANMHFKGLETVDAKSLGFSQSLDLLVQGHDPRKITSVEAATLLNSSKPLSVEALPGKQVSPKLEGTDPVPGSIVKSVIGPVDKAGELVPPAKPGDKGPTDAATVAGLEVIPAAAVVTKPYVTKAEQELNVGTVSKLAEMNTKEMKEWPDQRVLIADAIETSLGPIHAATTPSYKPMDPGYIQARNQAVAIANQVQSEKDLRYIDPLLSRFTSATNQHLSKGLSETANYKRELDLLAQEIHSTLVRNMKKAGINPDQVLASKNPPIFSIMHDGGSGPHTMRQIDGVWNIDHVLYPRNMVGVRSVTTSGIHGHEIGHDQYGGILKFEESIRENVIKNAVEKGLGTRAQDKVTVPGHGDMTKAQLIEHIFKAQADENTADIWGAAWTGHNGGGALGILLQSLRKGGQLETRNVYGKEFIPKDAPQDNPLGFEVHAFDALRPKIVAATMRARANGDQRVLDYAKALDRYSDEASRPGDYVFANMDKPGETITITRKDLEDVIPHLIDAQMNTPLPALQGKTFGDMLPDLPAHMAKMDNLADLMVDAVIKNKKPSDIPFDTQHYSINQVFGAGMPAALRLVAKGVDPTEANKSVNKMSDYLRALYHDNDPHVDPLKPTTLQAIRLNSPKELFASSKRVGVALTEATGRTIGKQADFREAVAKNTAGIGGALGANTMGDYYREQRAEKLKNMHALDLSHENLSATVAAAKDGQWLKSKDRTLSNISYMQGAKKQLLEPSTSLEKP